MIAIFFFSLMKFFVVSYYHLSVSFYLTLSHIYTISTKSKQWKEDKLTKQTENKKFVNCTQFRMVYGFLFPLVCAFFTRSLRLFWHCCGCWFVTVGCRYFNKNPFFFFNNLQQFLICSFDSFSAFKFDLRWPDQFSRPYFSFPYNFLCFVSHSLTFNSIQFNNIIFHTLYNNLIVVVSSAVWQFGSMLQ